MNMKSIQIQVTHEQDVFIEKERAMFGLSKSAYMRMLLGQAMHGTGQAQVSAQGQALELSPHHWKNEVAAFLQKLLEDEDL